MTPTPKHFCARFRRPTSVPGTETESSESKPGDVRLGLGTELQFGEPMTLLDLIRDDSFDPIYRAPHGGKSALADVKPWKHKNRLSIPKSKLRQSMACQCCHGSPYTPLDASGRRVCGYCRGLVMIVRARWGKFKTAGRDSERNGAA